jgi:glyoxylase I family protein
MRDANPINIRCLDHVVLRVEDLSGMVDWYCDVLGCRLERGPGKLGLAQLRAGTALIDLIDVAGPLGRPGGPAPGNEARNMDHFCVQVAPWEPDAIRAHLAAHGVETPDAEQRYGAEGSGPSLYIRDPEGNTVELKAGR